VRTSERHIADADSQNILEPPTGGGYCGRILFLLTGYYIFSTYDSISIRGITSMIQKWLDKLRDMTLDRVTLRVKLIADDD